MYVFYVLCALLCVTSVLTLATKKDKKLDLEIESANNSSSTTVEDIPDPKSENAIKSPAEKMVSPEEIKELNLSRLNSPVMEGGGKLTHATAPLSLEKVPYHPSISQEVSSSTSNSSKEGSQTERSVSPRKEAPPYEPVRINIKPRKGVGNETNFNETDLSSEDSNSKFNDQLYSSSVLSSSPNQTLKEFTTQKSETNSSTVIINLLANNTSVSEAPQKLSTEKVKKHKLKPTVTIGGSNVDAPIPASPTKTPPLGMPRKIDYIVPVMITIFALPLLGAATYVLYRRGRDCWDKRHYRRMDFLIDGMYNE